MALPEGGFFKDKVEQGRYGPIFPKTPASYGFSIEAICRVAGISQRTFYRWRNRLGGLPLASARKVRELEAENRRLRSVVSKLSATMASMHPITIESRPYPRFMIRNISG